MVSQRDFLVTRALPCDESRHACCGKGDSEALNANEIDKSRNASKNRVACWQSSFRMLHANCDVQEDVPIPVTITTYTDKSYDYVRPLKPCCCTCHSPSGLFFNVKY